MTGEKIVFLDFDGPMYPKRSFILSENRDENCWENCKKLNLHPQITYWKMDNVAIGMMNNFAGDDAKFVISSSWSNPLLHDRAIIENLLKVNGFNGQLHDDWMTQKNAAHRLDEIKVWLDNHPECSSYIILDDEVSAPEMKNKDVVEMYGIKNDRVFLVSVDNGILLNQYHQMFKMLNTNLEKA